MGESWLPATLTGRDPIGTAGNRQIR